MREIHLTHWAEFEERLDTLRGSRRRPDDLLFRGQANAKWSLRTTLERRGKYDLSVREYFRLLNIIKPEIESFTATEWDGPEYDEGSLHRDLMVGELPGYSYMLYLRQHGFPSPLLDWTASPYIAAYFAFRSSSAKERAIFVYSEMPEAGKDRSSRRPEIYTFGPSVRGHKRHFLQQSRYTLCIRFHQDLGSGQKEWRFTEHDDVFDRQKTDQDVIIKFVLPSAERKKILKLLDSFNLNSFSLFGSEDSLMDTISVREFDLVD